MSHSQSQKLMDARCRLLTVDPFYGSLAMGMSWTPSEMSWMPVESRTMGVRIVNGGDVQCVYYPDFVEKLSLKELYAVVQHELEHLVRVHCVRVGAERNPMAWNIAADMVVNGQKSRPRIGYHETSGSAHDVVIPFKDTLCWIPDGWPVDETTEHYYDRIIKSTKDQHCDRCGRKMKQGQKPGQKPKSGSGGKGKNDPNAKGQGKSEPGDGEGDQQDESGGGGDSHESCSKCGQSGGRYEYGEYGGTPLDDHSVWQQSEVGADEARQIVKDMVDQAVAKCQGNVPGHLTEAIKALAKPVVRWRDLLHQYVGQHVGNRRKTFSRRNRRRDEFGLPGISRHAAASVNVIIDTSGSVGAAELSQFFGEIDAMLAEVTVHVLQWDHAFQGYAPYRRGDWKHFKVCGRGGTDMAAPMQYLMDQRLVADCQIMMTDGHCNYLDASKISFPCITVITTPDTVSPPYGHVVRVK